MRICQDTLCLVGDTPMVQLSRLPQEYGAVADIYMKLEYFNPASSVKDRAAKYMVESAEKKGLLVPHSTPAGIIVEPTSGNTGIGLAFISNARGYRLILTMPESMSEERKKLLRGLGAELILTPAIEGVGGAVKAAQEILSATPKAIMLDQFSNPANVAAHYNSTGPEIWEQCRRHIDYFIAGIGTGGTITGVARYLKERSKTVKVYGVEPAESPLLSEGRTGPHVIAGIGANFVPALLDRNLLDGIITVPGDIAMETTRKLIRQEGIMCGISSGAAANAALMLGRKLENRGKRIVCIAPDTAERYLSTKLFA